MSARQTWLKKGWARANLDSDVLISQSPRMDESESHAIKHFESIFNAVSCQLSYYLKQLIRLEEVDQEEAVCEWKKESL